MATPLGKSRLLIKDWLIKQFDDGAYTSSGWIDRDQMKFCVPWTHQGRREFDPEDARIFEDWSRVAGTLKSTESPAQWKTRFRGALTKSPYIMDLKTEVLRTDGNQEKRCKTYQIINHKKNTMATMVQTPSTQQHTVPFDRDVSLQDIRQHMVVGADENLDRVTSYLNQTNELTYFSLDAVGEQDPQLLLDNFPGISFGNIDLLADPLIMPPIGQVTAVAPPETPYQQLSQPPGTPNQQLNQPPETPNQQLNQPPQTHNEQLNQLPQIHNEQLNQPPQIHNEQLNQPRAIKPKVEPDYSHGNDDSCQVDILYFGQPSTTYRFAEKCHLYDRSDPDSVSGDLLPRLEAMSKNKPEEAVKKARRILQPKNIKGGLLLEYDKGDIWATRLCLDQIFFSNFFTQTSCAKLQRNERQQIFSQDRFDEAYSEFKKGQAKMPSNEVCLGFALQWFFNDRQAALPISAIVKSRRNQWAIDEAKEHELSEQVCSLNISAEQDVVRRNVAWQPQINPLTEDPVPLASQHSLPITPRTSNITLSKLTFPEVTDAQTSSSYAWAYSPTSPASSIRSSLSQAMSPMMPNTHPTSIEDSPDH